MEAIPKKIVFIADGRSDHARRWIGYFSGKIEVILISTYQCKPLHGVKTIILPGRFRISEQLIAPDLSNDRSHPLVAKLLILLLRNRLINKIWNLAKLIDLFKQTRSIKKYLKLFNPDIVHALRIQNEGYLAAFGKKTDFIVSSWGSDFIDTAENNLLHRILTRITLQKTDYFFSDCKRDLSLSKKYGLSSNANQWIIPGNGGVDIDIFFSKRKLCRTYSILYCRGLSRITRIETLLDGYKHLRYNLDQDVKLTIMSPIATHSKWREVLKEKGLLTKSITLLDFVDPPALANIMQNHTVFVSPMTYDGIPNSMLEAMSCGMIPVMSDLSSIREHITNGVNGFVFDVNSSKELYKAFHKAFLSIDSDFRLSNQENIRKHYEYNICMKKVIEIYQENF
jgi:glycosyltransferase involved in cell wall biosynthesis